MINLFPNNKQRWPSQYGAATLIIAVVLLITSTLIIIFAANYARMQSKMTANLNRNAQAFAAAEAGLEFGINYLQKNASTILASRVSGFITPYSDASTSNVTLNNNSKFTVVYTNPTANNYNLILIKSTGTSDDGSATRVVQQQMQLGSLLTHPGTTSVTSKGAVTVSGNSNLTNTTTNNNIISGSTVSFSGSGTTNTSSGVTSNSSHLGSDVTQNNTSIANMSNNDFFASYFGTTSMSTVQNKMAHVYNNSSNTNYSSTLNGMTGTSIWITQTGGTTATINGTTTIGSAANPVLLVVNGSLSMSGNVTIYGFIFVIGTSGINSLTGNINLIGGMATMDILNMAGTSNLTYNPTVLNNLQANTSMSYWAKVAGTWKDF